MPPRHHLQMEPETKSVRTSQQCTGHTKTGARCKRRTARTPLCWTHLKSEQHLQIKTSGIPHTGLGLYTTIRRPAGKMVAPYTGHIVTRPENTYTGEYVIQLNHPPQAPPYKYIDANHTTSGAGRYSNMARRRNHRTNNSRLRPDVQHPDRAKVMSTRSIPAGGEVLTTYGRSYSFPDER